jgi:hypothetical protein
LPSRQEKEENNKQIKRHLLLFFSVRKRDEAKTLDQFANISSRKETFKETPTRLNYHFLSS